MAPERSNSGLVARSGSAHPNHSDVQLDPVLPRNRPRQTNVKAERRAGFGNRLERAH